MRSSMSFAVPRWLRIAAVAALHLAALGVLWRTEYDLYGAALFLLAWGAFNGFFLVLLRRPAISAALSLAVFSIVIVLSQFKSTITWMTISFLDVLIIDSDTVAFLLTIFPDLRMTIIIAAVLAIPVLVLLWRLDPFRVRRSAAA